MEKVELHDPGHHADGPHIKVVGPGGRTPGPIVRFPGAYSLDDPGEPISIWDRGGADKCRGVATDGVKGGDEEFSWGGTRCLAW